MCLDLHYAKPKREPANQEPTVQLPRTPETPSRTSHRAHNPPPGGRMGPDSPVQKYRACLRRTYREWMPHGPPLATRRTKSCIRPRQAVCCCGSVPGCLLLSVPYLGAGTVACCYAYVADAYMACMHGGVVPARSPPACLPSLQGR